MTEDIKNALDEVLAKHICTLKKVSKDGSNNENMCNSWLEVVNYDKIPNEYCNIKNIPIKPCSNDALYITKDNEWWFIEFKNGEIQKDNLFRKIYDSLLMLLELNIIQNFEFSREHISYVLVYNSKKYGKAEASKDRDVTYNYFLQLAKEEKKLFEVEKLEKYLLKETHTYTKEQFEEYFIIPMEKEEKETNRYADKM